MIAKHTPGPWFLDDGADVELPGHIGISANKHSLLAQVVWKMEDDERSPECEANAYLISAAPELLKELQVLRDWYEEVTGMTAKAANAAIAKAIR